eukprot:10966049-Alexandrium_andersonii.AAC.1
MGKRLLILGDSLTVALASAKGRSSSKGLASVLRRIAALALASGSSLHFRWLPSEANAADGPSREAWTVSAPKPLLDPALVLPPGHAAARAARSAERASAGEGGAGDRPFDETLEQRRGGACEGSLALAGAA